MTEYLVPLGVGAAAAMTAMYMYQGPRLLPHRYDSSSTTSNAMYHWRNFVSAPVTIETQHEPQELGMSYLYGPDGTRLIVDNDKPYAQPFHPGFSRLTPSGELVDEGLMNRMIAHTHRGKPDKAKKRELRRAPK